MKYKALHKQYIIIGNQIINPDGFGSWKIFNYGTNTITINDTIEIQAGESYSVELMPDVKFDTNINIKFNAIEGGKSRAAIVLIYHKEQ